MIPPITALLVEYHKSRYEISISSIERSVFESMVLGLNLLKHGLHRQAEGEIRMMGLMKALPQLYLDYATYCEKDVALQYLAMAVSLDGRLEHTAYDLRRKMGWESELESK